LNVNEIEAKLIADMTDYLIFETLRIHILEDHKDFIVFFVSCTDVGGFSFSHIFKLKRLWAFIFTEKKMLQKCAK